MYCPIENGFMRNADCSVSKLAINTSIRGRFQLNLPGIYQGANVWETTEEYQHKASIEKGPNVRAHEEQEDKSWRWIHKKQWYRR